MAKDRLDAGRGRRAEVVKKSKATSKTPFYAALAVIGLVGVGALAYVASRPKNVATSRLGAGSVNVMLGDRAGEGVRALAQRP